VVLYINLGIHYLKFNTSVHTQLILLLAFIEISLIWHEKYTKNQPKCIIVIS